MIVADVKNKLTELSGRELADPVVCQHQLLLLRVLSSGVRIQGFRFRVDGSGIRKEGIGFRISGSGFGALDVGQRAELRGTLRESERMRA